MPEVQTQPSLFMWGLMAVFTVLPVFLGLAGVVARQRDTPFVKPQVYWFCALHALTFLVALGVTKFMPSGLLAGFGLFLPFMITILYAFCALVLRSRTLWAAAASTLGLWYIVQTVLFSDAPFYLPDLPHFYGAVGAVLCLMPLFNPLTQRMAGTVKIDIAFGVAYFILALLIVVSWHLDFLFKNVASTATVVLPVGLFLWGMDALRKQPDSSKGDWILFAAAHALAFCILSNVFVYTRGMFPFGEYILPVAIALVYAGISFIFKSSSWWIVAITIPGVWIPFFHKFLKGVPLLSWGNLLVIAGMGMLIMASYLVLRSREFVQDSKREMGVAAVAHFSVALLLCARLLAGMPDMVSTTVTVPPAKAPAAVEETALPANAAPDTGVSVPGQKDDVISHPIP